MEANTRYANRPWESNEERLTTMALQATEADTLAIQAIRPPIPRMGLFPPRFGISDGRALGIADIVRIDQRYPGARTDYAGYRSGPGFSSSSTPSMGVI